MAAANPVNPSPAEIGERDKVLIIRKPIRLEASHLAGGGCLLRCSTTANADRGGPMRAKATALLLADLGATKSHSRPHTSNDNPFSESHFKTMKYQPQFPQRFGCIQDAKAFCRNFFDWYNQEHHHAGIGLMTPDQGALRSGRRNPRRPPEHPRWCLQQKPGTLRQKGARTACKANGDLDQSTGEIAKHPSLNSTLGCLKIVDTFRAVPTTPADRAGARVDCFPTHAAFPKWQEGRHPHCHFRGLLRLHSRYGLPDSSAA